MSICVCGFVYTHKTTSNSFWKEVVYKYLQMEFHRKKKIPKALQYQEFSDHNGLLFQSLGDCLYFFPILLGISLTPQFSTWDVSVHM